MRRFGWFGALVGAFVLALGIQMGDLRLTGEMPAAHFERFEHWKLGLSQASPIAA